MKFNWKVVQPNTLRAYTVAARDFETATGIRADQADVISIAAWQNNMEERGLAVGTIRTRLSAISTITGIKIQLPKRDGECGKTLSLEQVKLFFNVIKSRTDRALMASIFFTGAQPQSIPAHFAGLGVSDGDNRLTTQEITRRVKRYAKMAGLNEAEMNLRTMKRSGKALMDEQDALELLKVTTPSPSKDRNRISYRPLHGIGRRSQMSKA